ncbi:MAG: gliding motility-associated C-terminal domain-containing protein [Bacteroidota bacterium]|nr:gliding motility-associated C-terminal domain-containing protein [Bacteroidota bacterium]
MTKLYNSTSRIFKISALALFLVLGLSQTASASHALPIIGLTGTLGPTDFIISGSSDPATCAGTSTIVPYWMQVEITCDPNGFTGAPPVASSTLWGTIPWFHSSLNIPGPPYNDQCALEAYNNIVIPLSQLCPGTTYYWRVREFCEPNSAAAWMGPFSFVTPGSPPASNLTATGAQYVVCPGSTVQLNAIVSGGCPGGTYTYSWQPTTGLSNPNIQNPIATVNSPITYTVTAGGGCFTITSSDDTVQIAMGPPVLPGSATANPATICSGQSSQVILTGMGSNVIQWQVSPNGLTWFNMAGQTDDTLNTGPLTSSLYYQAIVTGSGWPGNGCGTSTSSPTQVTVSPSPSANAGANSTICNGSCANLTGTGGVSYDWQPGNLSGSNVSVCPSSTTDYTLTVTDGNGCTATDNVTVNISSASTTASPDVNICTGSSTILLASGPNGNTYNWTPNNSTIAGANTANPTATPPVTTTYTVTATNGFGCTATDSVIVTVSAAPPLTVSNDTAMCTGGNATLTASGATSYTWQPGNFTGPSISVNPSTTTIYTVTGNNNNCLSIDSVVVTINPPPYVFAGPDFNVCAGSQATMNVATTGTSYSWTPTSGIIGSNTTQSIVTAPVSNTSYTVTVSGPGGCISTDTINVIVNPIPAVTASSPDNTICTGLSTTVSASGASSYSWIPASGLATPTSASSTANPSTTTTYQVIGTDANGCMDTASITITVNPLPGVYITSTPTECGDSTGTMVNSGVVTGTAPFTFAVGSNPASSTLPTNMTGGAYTVVTTDANGCMSSQVVTVGMVNNSFVSAAANPTFGTYPLPVGFGSSGSSGLTNYNWNFGDGIGSANTQSANYTYTSPGTYQVVLTAWNDWFGCAVYDTITIEVVEEAVVLLPNVFTPNSDGSNDGFAATISGVKDIKVQVFNRWGAEVFEGSQTGLAGSPQVLQLWDGQTTGGNASDDGVYYYVVTAVGFDTKDYSYSGFVHLFKTKP